MFFLIELKYTFMDIIYYKMNKFNFIYIKHCILLILIGSVFYCGLLVVSTYRNHPEFEVFSLNQTFKSKSVSTVRASSKTIASKLSHYKVVGYRASDQRSSVVLQKGKSQYVIQQGDYLEDTYQLHSVSKDKVKFLHNDTLIDLPNKVSN